MSFPGRFTEAPPKEVPLLLQMQGSREAEKQGSREGPKLLSTAWKEHRSPPLPSIWAPGKIATWRNRALEKKHIEDEKFQISQCSTKQNGSHWSEHFLTQTMHLCKSGVYNLNGSRYFWQDRLNKEIFFNAMVLPFNNNIRPAWIGSPCVISCV